MNNEKEKEDDAGMMEGVGHDPTNRFGKSSPNFL